ncbi:ATP-binding SpoIIE family protein phosphatase [Spirilliplanes yamanashiensis]|uniref:Transcriptional regulator n=1 Tax=Spirilliplanes yamanashiensis TaxID=42233 RepID=A0A8J3YEH4_9ACTN|nr:ATP-binding SpoIIE family protein phosphatase [Spirilliplanes yamanashiensis]MDP9815286.1 anti-sigma regulatory factor (Ser/Thr protein kinase) [Spirilliplanes yamanashiensis]GIJ06444.1 transcriptional regulator [Spirilliplanes yamanashiensis]
MSLAPDEGLAESGLWFRVEASSTAAAVRRAAERVAAELGLPEARANDLAIVAAEVAGNLVKHADQGVLVLRPVRTAGQAGVELIAADSGPGMADVERSLNDGHSTSGTLGIGLGAVARLASWCDLHSVPGKGTVLAAQVWPGEVPPPAWAAGLTRPLTGETVSGDGYATREAGGRRQVLVCDGLGHGPLAAAATQAAVAAFHTAPAGPPAAVVEHLHRSMRHTRGAALAVAEPGDGVLRYAGLGNIGGTIVPPGGQRRGLVSLPGIAGHQRRQVREYEYELAPGAVLVMHSDGVVDRWDLAVYPGLASRSPQLIAATLLRDAGTRRDDACVLVARAGTLA